MSDAVPILFTVNGSTRHELLLVSPSKAGLEGVSAEMVRLAAASPNCEEFMSKYKKKPESDDELTEMRVRWNPQSHDPKIFPQTTVVTDDNFEAIVRMIAASGVGRDVLEVKIGSPESK